MFYLACVLFYASYLIMMVFGLKTGYFMYALDGSRLSRTDMCTMKHSTPFNNYHAQ